MRKTVVLALCLTASTVFAQTVSLPPYDSQNGISRYAAKEEYERAAHDVRFELRKVAYSSDGLRVYAYVYSPRRHMTTLPVVIYNRGSFVRDEFAAELIATFHRLGEAGFIVVAPMYRQSGGGDGHDEMGGADVDDLMNVAKLVPAIEGADPANVFLYGQSRGGMMVYQAMRDGFPARAAAVFGGFTDLHAMLAASPQLMALATKIWPDYATNAAAIEARRSALAWPDKLGIPILIMHGGQDKDVDPAQSLALAQKLQALGKEYELVVHAGSNHVLSDWRVQRDALAVDWFRTHAKS